MASVNHLRVQHRELLRLARDIVRRLETERLGTEQTAIRLKLATFARKLRVHLVVEGRIVFERLVHHTNPAVVTQATEAQRDAQSLRNRASHASRQWISKGLAIDDTANKLIEETKSLFELVSTRLEFEESELYPLVDQTGDRSGTWPIDSTEETDETSKTG